MSKNINNSIDVFIEQWVVDILADPITKKTAKINDFKSVDGIIDARVMLKNTLGFSEWIDGQTEYEDWAEEYDSLMDMEDYEKEIEKERPVYAHFKMAGVVLDVGGGIGTVREHIDKDTKFISIDPHITCTKNISQKKIKSYSCLSDRINFIGGVAEFMPFIDSQFDWVHMRSMLDHCQVPDLVLLEAHRVLKDNGNLLIGLYVEGGQSGDISIVDKTKHLVKDGLSVIGIDKWKDHHTWHPTFANLQKLITDNGFSIDDVYWQPFFKDKVCYILARKS